MAHQYSKTTGFFYDTTLDYTGIPNDAVKVPDADYTALFLAQSRGAKIVAGSNGNPTAVSEGGNGSPIDLSTVTATSNYFAPIALATQAATALVAARTYVLNNYYLLAETPPDSWVTYQKALRAIASGTDTTSTALPTEPTS